MDAAKDSGRASKEKESHFPDHLMLLVVYWFKSQETLCIKETLIWTVNYRPPCWRNQVIYPVPAEEEGVTKFSLSQHFLWYDEWLFSTCTLHALLNSSSGCFSLQTCTSSVADGLFSLWKVTFFQGMDFLLLSIPQSSGEMTRGA